MNMKTIYGLLALICLGLSIVAQFEKTAHHETSFFLYAIFFTIKYEFLLLKEELKEEKQTSDTVM
jgi:hypothetical protein